MTRHVRDRAVRRRDAAVRRLRRAKQGLTALSFLLAGVVGTAAGRSFPGRSSHHAAAVTRTATDRATQPAAPREARHVDRSAASAAHTHARLRVRRGRVHQTATRTQTQTHTQAQTQAQTTTSPAPPATTPAPAPSTSAAVTSGGS